MRWRLILGATGALFTAGVYVGYVANKNGIPKNEIPRWMLKSATRKTMDFYDKVADAMPHDRAQPLSEAIAKAERQSNPGGDG